MYSTVVIPGESNLFHLRICRRCLYHSCQNGESASPTQQGHLSAKRRIRENRIGRTSCRRKKELRKVEWENFSHLSTRSGHKGKNVLTNKLILDRPTEHSLLFSKLTNLSSEWKVKWFSRLSWISTSVLLFLFKTKNKNLQKYYHPPSSSHHNKVQPW